MRIRMAAASAEPSPVHLGRRSSTSFSESKSEGRGMPAEECCTTSSMSCREVKGPEMWRGGSPATRGGEEGRAERMGRNAKQVD